MKFPLRMSRRRLAKKIPNQSDFKAAFCRRTYCNPKQNGGIFIAKLVVAEKPSVAVSYAKVLGATSRKDGYLEGNGYLVSWCVGHLVELAPPNIYDAKYVKWSIADLPILPQKWQYLVSASRQRSYQIDFSAFCYLFERSVMPLTQPKTDLAYLRSEKAKAEQKLRACQHREKILERQMSELNRRERVHRLCTRAGMLESFLVCPGELTDDQVMELLKISFRQPEVVLALAKMVHDVHERSNVQNPLE